LPILQKIISMTHMQRSLIQNTGTPVCGSNSKRGSRITTTTIATSDISTMRKISGREVRVSLVFNAPSRQSGTPCQRDKQVPAWFPCKSVIGGERDSVQRASQRVIESEVAERS
jgi:hypothetical protein